MAKPYSATRLRANLYRILDEVLATGVPAEVARRGKTLRIVRTDGGGRLSKLDERRDYLDADPEYLVHMDWSAEWRP